MSCCTSFLSVDRKQRKKTTLVKTIVNKPFVREQNLCELDHFASHTTFGVCIYLKTGVWRLCAWANFADAALFNQLAFTVVIGHSG